MNVPHKFLINNISDTKMKFYEKLPKLYSKIIVDFTKKKSNYENFSKKVINWLFSQNEETKMILCSVENKKCTNTIYEAYNYHINNSQNIKFKIVNGDSSDSDKYTLDYNNINFDKYFNKKKYSKFEEYKKKNDFLNIHNKFLNNLLFYQSETPINDYQNYNNYFTLNPKFLVNENIFKNECDELAFNKFLHHPIELKRDSKIKTNLNFQLPQWIQDNNEENKLNQNYPYDTDEIDINYNHKYFTLSQYILALIEQVLSIRYILYNETKNLKEIVSSTYLYDLFDKKKSILSYINSINLESNMYYKYFKISEINTNIFLSQEIESFLEEKKKSIKIADNSIDFTKDENEIFVQIENIFQNIVEKNKNDKNEFNKELINMCMFIHINELFTLDDFFLRSIFEKFYSEYLNQIYNDLIVNEEEKPKKRKKKKKKNINNNNINDKSSSCAIINDKEEIFIFVKKLILDNLEKNINKINESNSININNKKEKNKKEKEFFLYESTKKKDKKKSNNKQNNNKNNKLDNNNNNNEKKNNVNHLEQVNNEDNKSKNSISNINNGINSFTTNSDSDKIKYFPFLEKISTDKLSKLNNDITNFNEDIEELLIIFRKIKKEIKNHFEIIIKDVYKNNSQIEIYGSSLYKLDIESSDLDLSISTKSNLSLEAIGIYLTKNNQNNQYLNINQIYTASIPIIKLEVDYHKLNIDNINNYYNSLINNNYYKICVDNNIYKEFNTIKVDISLKSINYNQIHFIKSGIRNFPQLKPLIKILKKLLILKNMNNSYKGGMSSYCLFLLVFSYLKLIPNNKKNNYSSLLLGFLYYYTNNIDFSYTQINPNLDNPFEISNFHLETIPTIIDPSTMKNAGKIVYRIIDVVKVFNDIYNDIFLILKEDKNDENIIYKLFNKYSENKNYH